ncbi:MAG: SurA N-terminal domain-containing protein, partial [Anaerolineales bacterium]
MRYSKDILKYYLILLLGLILVACGPEEPTPTEFSPTLTIQAPTATFSPEPPTPTPEPLAAIVNGEEITLAEFESEFQRFFASQDLDQLDLSEDAELIVLQELIDRLLFAQSARQEGFVLSDEDLQARMATLVAEVGGEDEMAKWLEEQGYNQSNFIEALRVSIAAAWMRDLILSEVPETAEQVHARQIFTTDQDQADRIFTQLQG